jgi:small subunit ribosomal protein S16
VAVTLRLTRMGAIKRPYYRVVAADKSRARDGKFLEILGHYNPADYPNSVTLNEEKIRVWLDKGAQPSAAVKKLLSLKGLTAKKA